MTGAVASVVPIADTIRINSVCGSSVVSRRDRRLQEEALTFTFEIAVTEDCVDGACSDSDDIQQQTSSSIQSTLSSNVFETAVQEEAVANDVAVLTNAAVKSAEVKVIRVEVTTPEPTLSPTIAPTYENVCVDSSAKFYNPLSKKWKGCEWIARNKTRSRCNRIPYVKTHCPQTCGACSAYQCNNSRMNFQLQNKAAASKVCWYFRMDLRPERAKRLCEKDYFASTCRETCGRCSRTF